MPPVADAFTTPGRVLLCIALVLPLLQPLELTAQTVQRLETPSSANPVGSGARALGMGGAFIAVADDATAASWNPGGLVQLERPEASAVGGVFHRTERNRFSANPEASGDESVSKAYLNYLSVSYPFALLGRNMIVSVSYQYLYDLKRSWHFTLADPGAVQTVRYRQDGSLSAIGISYCIEIVPRLSFGFTLNVWEDPFYGNGWTQTAVQQATTEQGGQEVHTSSEWVDRFSLSGFNANVGVLWNVTDRWTVGAVLKTPFSADLEHESTFSSSVRFPANPANDVVSTGTPVREDAKLEMPMSYGIGVAFRASDRWTLAADVYRTEWGRYFIEGPGGEEVSPVTGRPRGESDVDATHQVRLGTEYLFLGDGFVAPLHAGVFYDPVPAAGSPDPFFGVSVGSGVYVGRLGFDAAYQFRFGRDAGEVRFRDRGFSQDVDEHTVYFSLVFRL